MSFEKLADVLDDLHQFVQRVALPAGEVDELLGPRDDRASLGRTNDRDPASPSELEQAFIPQAEARGARCWC